MPTATCHCGTVCIEVPGRPRQLTDCNCSICRRYGALWAYFKVSAARIACPPRELSHYSWGDESLRFFRCKTCGCITHWLPVKLARAARMGVNARHFEPRDIATARIRRLDGADTWKYSD